MGKTLPAPRHIKRLAACLVDVLICWLLASQIPLLLSLIVGANVMPFSSIMLWVAVAYLLFKDALPRGQSLGKRMLGLAVIGSVTYQDCSWWQSALRNLVLPVLFPLEAIVILLSGRRIGDALASTMVIDSAVGLTT
ncbi:RDD family protein [Halopseudomonas phragmitis]|uniref:RDD domain-containing protein n=1 Tax=Halopseudomonas phragmitis TaxID=1931241 RepID=A0A1V0B1V8_9GAMM|nr:RDD family protein [Halopseudomonas phragmitis]AQZ93927.1 hypothetical protein BVH74_03800 [Halopseudomonas phragmitis]